MTPSQQAELEQVARDILMFWIAAQNLMRPDPLAKWSQDLLVEQIVKALAETERAALESVIKRYRGYTWYLKDNSFYEWLVQQAKEGA